MNSSLLIKLLIKEEQNRNLFLEQLWFFFLLYSVFQHTLCTHSQAVTENITK